MDSLLTEKPLISIVIPTYNRRELLKKMMVEMVQQQTNDLFDYEILIIDDGSTDDTSSVVHEIAGKSAVPVRYIPETGLGYTGVLNRAVREFNGQWLAFFDDDQYTHTTWLKELYKIACTQKADMVGGPIVLDIPDSVLAGIGPICRDIYGESPDVRFPEYYKDKRPYPGGGNRIVHRRVFDKIGAFDELMLTGGCDRDFLLRALAAEVPMGWAPKAEAYHMIKPDRFTYDHIKWYSLQFGCAFAYIDWKRFGGVITTLACVARIGQALLVNFPMLVCMKIRGNKAGIKDRQALLWRAVGYTRKTLQMISPKTFHQEDFFSKVEFRRIQNNSTQK